MAIRLKRWSVAAIYAWGRKFHSKAGHQIVKSCNKVCCTWLEKRWQRLYRKPDIFPAFSHTNVHASTNVSNFGRLACLFSVNVVFPVLWIAYSSSKILLVRLSVHTRSKRAPVVCKGAKVLDGCVNMQRGRMKCVGKNIQAN